MRSDEAEAADGGATVGGAQPVDRADELSKIRPTREIEATTGPALGVDVGEATLGRQVVAVRVDVLAEQRDLAVAGCRQSPRLVEDVVEGAAALRTPAAAHDAIGACLVAAVDDRQPGGDRRPAGDRPLAYRAGPCRSKVIRDADDGAPD